MVNPVILFNIFLGVFMKDHRPHIIIFNPDEMRADALHHLGNMASHTPNMDALTQDGVSFRNAYCQNPVCTPSRCSFMSGWYPHVHGHRTISYMMHKEEPVLLRDLKDEGYYVWINGRNDLIPAAGNRPFKTYASKVCNPKSVRMPEGRQPRGELGSENFYSQYRGIIETENGEDVYDMDAAWVQGAIDCIRHRPKDKPLCLFLPVMYPHTPYQTVKKYYDMIDPAKMPARIKTPGDLSLKPSMIRGLIERQGLQGWDEDRWTELRRVYLAMCARVDDQLGQVIAALKEEGMYDDSAIFVLSDHGDFTGDYGISEKNQNTFEDCLTNVPFIIKPPKSMAVKPGISDALVELVDFYATVEDITGMKPTHTHFGKSLRAVLSGVAPEHRDAVFCEGGRLKQELQCNESSHYPSLIEEVNEYYPRISLQTSQGPEHTKATMIRNKDFKYVKRLYEKDELYDLKTDKENLRNLIDDPAYTGVILDLKERMLTWLQETADAVPFEADERYPKEYILAMVKGSMPWGVYMFAKILLTCGYTVADLLKIGQDMEARRKQKHKHE